MSTRMPTLWLLAALALSATGCAKYRTDTDITFDSTDVSVDREVLISQNSLPGRKYVAIGAVDAEVKKLAFGDDPTEEQVNIVLAAKAKKMGGDAVVNVTYDSGIGLTSLGVIKAEGIAVRFTDGLSAQADYEAGRAAFNAGRYEEATQLWRSAAAEGDVNSLYALGKMYGEGLGVLRDYVNAYAYFAVAAARGHTSALQARQYVEQQLSDAELARADQLAESYYKRFR